MKGTSCQPICSISFIGNLYLKYSSRTKGRSHSLSFFFGGSPSKKEKKKEGGGGLVIVCFESTVNSYACCIIEHAGMRGRRES